MNLRTVGAGSATVLVLVLLALLLFQSNDEPDPAPSTTQSARTKTAGEPPRASRQPAEPGSPISPSYLKGPEERASAEAVKKVYGGLAEAVDAGVVPLYADVRTALDEAQDVAGLTEICDAMSGDARDETVEYARVTARLGDFDWTCEKAVALLIRRVKVNRNLKRAMQARVVTVNIDGDRATATLDYGNGEPLRSIPLVKEDDGWKIGSPPTGG